MANDQEISQTVAIQTGPKLLHSNILNTHIWAFEVRGIIGAKLQQAPGPSLLQLCPKYLATAGLESVLLPDIVVARKLVYIKIA